MKKKVVLKKLAELREHVQNGVPHDLTFMPVQGTKEQKQRLQDSLNYHFGLWRETWIYPWLDQIEHLIRTGK